VKKNKNCDEGKAGEGGEKTIKGGGKRREIGKQDVKDDLTAINSDKLTLCKRGEMESDKHLP